jgi:TatD DNase family protein
MFVDTHCHLFFSEYENDIEEVIKRANDVGVHFIIVPGTDYETSKKSIALAERFECVYAAVGFHPHDASKANSQALEAIEQMSFHEKVVAIGEIGLDFYYDYSPRDAQREIFLQQIEIAIRREMPIIVHDRETNGETYEVVFKVAEEKNFWMKTKQNFESRYPPPRGVFHCFASDTETARKAIDNGFYISIPGPVTFPSKKEKRNMMEEVVSQISMEHILLETDAPFLTPIPFRGKRNEPSHIPLIAEKIAALHTVSVEDVGRTSSFGAHKLFGIGKYPKPVFTYKIKNSLYINHTIRCNADCVFCDRKGEAAIWGYNLKIEREPTSEEIIREIREPKKFDEIVFCGYGEPTIRLDVLKEVSSWVKKNGGNVRLNTDGHGSVINKRNIVPELVGCVDSVSISLNSIDKKQYGELMRVNPEIYFPAMIEFAKQCVANNIETTMTIVDLKEVEEPRARDVVEKEIGAKFRIRKFF